MSKATNFDYRISKKDAEFFLRRGVLKLGIAIMCKEYGPDEEWCEVTKDDLRENGRLDGDYKTFEVWI